MYDFCDRWCEKCKKCDRCMNYFLMEEMKARSETLPKEIRERKEGEDGWAHLKKMLGVAYKMLREVVKENGLNMEDVCGFDQLHRDMMKVGDLDKQEEEETIMLSSWPKYRTEWSFPQEEKATEAMFTTYWHK